jgi:hypothetical protein
MTDHKNRENSQGPSSDGFDRELDAALARYVAVEPRTGLEERVLSNLCAERQRSIPNSWWQWPAVAAFTALLLITGFVAWQSTWRSPRPVQNVANHSLMIPTIANEGVPSAPQGGVVVRPSRKSRHGAQLNASSRRHPAPIFGSAPRLDQFPSPQPLSEQEAILARYVTKYPEHAALIAQARTDELQRDSAEEAGAPASESFPARNK